MLGDRTVHVLRDGLVAGRVRRRVLGKDPHRVRLEHAELDPEDDGVITLGSFEELPGRF